MTKTRNPDRMDAVLAAIKMYWQQNPDFRLGQIVCNAAYQSGNTTPFSLEDNDLARVLMEDSYYVGEDNV